MKKHVIVGLATILIVASSCMARKSNSSSSSKSVSSSLSETCGEPASFGFYQKQPDYHNRFLMPAPGDENNLYKYCRPSPGECNASSPVFGHAVCEAAAGTSICPPEDGDDPVLCFPGLN